jgi:anti-sigma factor RsiW
MQKLNDELLVAYLDGELDDKQQADIEARLEQDAFARDRLARLGESTALVRAAFDELLREEVPQHLITAIHTADAAAGNAPEPGGEAQILPFRMRQAARGLAAYRRWWIAVPVAASLFGVMLGGGLGYFGLGSSTRGGEQQVAAIQAAATNGWLDNVAEFHKLFISASTAENSFADIPATDNGGEVIQKISQRTSQQNLRVPDLKPWGLVFQGARLVVVEGRSAAQLVYTAADEKVGKAIGPLTVLIGATKRPDLGPAFERRQDVNMLYWRRKGHVYAIVGQASSGYMWGLANDIEWQLNAI